MPWPLFLLVISVCLIHDIQSAPQQDSDAKDQQNLCGKCQITEVPGILTKYAMFTLENDAEIKELCSNLSVCDPFQNDWLWKQRPMSTCEQCRWTILGLTDEMIYEKHPLPYERLQYHTKQTADLLKETCRDNFSKKYFSDFCALIYGRESEIVKSAFDCTGVKFKDDESEINCMAKACESFVESCTVAKFPWPNEE